MVVVAEPSSLQRLFAAGPDEVCQPRNSRFLKVLGPGSLLLLNGDEHRRHRRLLLPALRAQDGPRSARALLDEQLKAMARWPLETPFSLLAALQDLTRRTTVLRLFGLSERARQEALIGLCAAAISALERPEMVLPLSLQTLLGAASPWARALRLLEAGDRLIYAAIAERRTAPDLALREDVLSQLLLARDESGRPLGDAELRDELFTLLAAGNDTTAIALCWTMHELFKAPGLARALRLELQSSRRGGALDCEAVEQAPLLEATLRESMRLWPVFPIVARLLLKPMRLASYELPPGTRVVACPYLAHRRAESFPQPLRFLPERFLSNRPSAAKAAYFPFGGGLRRCVGAELALREMKLLLGTLLAHPALALWPAQAAPLLVPAWRFFSLAPSNGLPVILRQRTSRSAQEIASDELHLKAVSLPRCADGLDEVAAAQLPQRGV